MTNYRYIFLGSSGELAQFSFSDLDAFDKAMYVPGFYSQFGRLERFFFHLHTNNRFNKILNLPFKHLWKKIVLKDIPIIPNSGETLVYICQRGWADYEPQLRFIEYIKKNNPNAKFVLFLEDLMSTYTIHDRGNHPYSQQFLNKIFDLVISFDQGDCEKYGFLYHPLVFSKYKSVEKMKPLLDVYFLGAAKNRLGAILETFEVLNDYGLKCDIHIAGVKKDERKYADIIDYEPKISYMENLKLASRSKCILELMQKGGKGYTQRTYEAIGLGKMLLTNNEMIHKAPFYNPDYIVQFDSPRTITKEQIEAIKKAPEYVDYHYIDKISPLELISFVESHLDNSKR